MGRGATDSLFYFSQSGSTYVRCFEKVRYGRRVGDIFGRFGGSPFSDWTTDHGEVIGLSRPHDEFYFFTNCCYWLRNVYFECYMPACEQGILAGWLNLEFFTASPLNQRDLCARRPLMWKPIECCSVLTVSNSPVLTCYARSVVNFRLGPDAVWNIAAFKLVTMGLVQILFAPEHGVVSFPCYYPQMDQGGCGVLAPLAHGVGRHMGHYSFLSFVLCCAFNLALAFLAYRRSGEIDWFFRCVFSC